MYHNLHHIREGLKYYTMNNTQTQIGKAMVLKKAIIYLNIYPVRYYQVIVDPLLALMLGRYYRVVQDLNLHKDFQHQDMVHQLNLDHLDHNQ